MRLEKGELPVYFTYSEKNPKIKRICRPSQHRGQKQCISNLTNHQAIVDGCKTRRSKAIVVPKFEHKFVHDVIKAVTYKTVLSLGKIIEFELFAPLQGYFGRVLGNFLPLQDNDLTTLAQNPEQALKTVPKLVNIGPIIQKLRVSLVKAQIKSCLRCFDGSIDKLSTMSRRMTDNK